MPLKKLLIDGETLTIRDVYEVACCDRPVGVAPAAAKKVEKCRRFVDKLLTQDKPVYGINTGFGILSEVAIPKDHLDDLQMNLIRSHAIGIGDPFDRATVRAIMLLRANVLAKGFSGVRLSTLEKLVEFINADIVPYIPQKGSVGASGDLAPLSHLALALCGEGYCLGDDMKPVDTAGVLKKKKVTPIALKAKEGLALINGTQVMTAVGALTVERLFGLSKLADISLALTVDAMLGTDRAFDEKVSRVRAHPGQFEVSRNVRKLIAGSTIRESHRCCTKVQDSYSIRCAPQVHGAVRDALHHAVEVLTTELNSSTDNPLIFPDERETISAGNFHGEPVALVMDYLAAAASELGNISERRIEQMVNPVFSQLPAFLVKDKGLHSGFMIAQVAAAGLVSESKSLSFPASVDSIPTSAGKEDHVSMGTIAARKCAMVAENTACVLALEVLIACQALDLRKPLKTSKALQAVHRKVRGAVPFMDTDRFLHPDFAKVRSLERELVAVAEKAAGPLV
ncbi:MAG TPA: histidine ammonia-lyase [bacterium]|nr:histidine ammonia-lyase [bacterium]